MQRTNTSHSAYNTKEAEWTDFFKGSAQQGREKKKTQMSLPCMEKPCLCVLFPGRWKGKEKLQPALLPWEQKKSKHSFASKNDI